MFWYKLKRIGYSKTFFDDPKESFRTVFFSYLFHKKKNSSQLLPLNYYYQHNGGIFI